MSKIIKFLTAGSVDDGKSTLLGKLLHDSNAVYKDHLDDAIINAKDGLEIDYSLLLDGLGSERQQGITIDVAYRYFTVDDYNFIIADAPGHEEYTRNMSVAAANSDIAILLIDSVSGIQSQTIRHSKIISLFGIKNIIVIVNKMDLIGYSEERFEQIKKEYSDLKFNFDNISFIPVSAIHGDNVVHHSDKISWYKGNSLIKELLKFADFKKDKYFTSRVQVQHVQKNKTDRWYLGINRGSDFAVGDKIIVNPSKQENIIKDIIRNYDSVSILLDKEVDITRGAVLSKANDLNQPNINSNFKAKLLWFAEDEECEGEELEYIIKINQQYLNCVISSSSKKFIKNHINDVEVLLSSNVAFDEFIDNNYTGSFILINEFNNETVAIGLIANNNDYAI